MMKLALQPWLYTQPKQGCNLQEFKPAYIVKIGEMFHEVLKIGTHRQDPKP
jgi:hypothetical protein